MDDGNFLRFDSKARTFSSVTKIKGSVDAKCHSKKHFSSTFSAFSFTRFARIPTKREPKMKAMCKKYIAKCHSTYPS